MERSAWRMNHGMNLNHPIVINGTNAQSLQHYLVSNHIAANPNQPHQNVQVQLVKKEPHGPYYINQSFAQQPQAIVQDQVAPLYWVLVDTELSNELNSYAVVESKDICEPFKPIMDSLGTGKLIVVVINGKQRRVTVVMCSDQKKFIYDEFHQLKKMADENLNLKQREVQVRKRSRLSVSRDNDEESSHSGWSGVSQNNVIERVLSPSVHIQQTSKGTDARSEPPMVFDQWTQTDSRMNESTSGLLTKIQKLIELNEQLLNKQEQLKQELKNEAKMSRLLVESFTDEFTAMRKSLQTVETKMESFVAERGIEVVENDDGEGKKKILNGSGTQPIFIIETQEGNASGNTVSLNGSNMEYTVEEVEGDDSGRSTSRTSYHDQASMMSNSSVDYTDKRPPMRRTFSSSNFAFNSSTPIARANSSSNLVEEWTNIDGEVTIGRNGTKVEVHKLRAIDWNNYKTATRKLLTTLFDRETLANRSLTGRPSPAFHDRNKPVKLKLDQNIIGDIIEVVTRKCAAQEGQVRTAITTKCADENKMMRNRKENEENKNFKKPGSTGATENKENVVDN